MEEYIIQRKENQMEFEYISSKEHVEEWLLKRIFNENFSLQEFAKMLQSPQISYHSSQITIHDLLEKKNKKRARKITQVEHLMIKKSILSNTSKDIPQGKSLIREKVIKEMLHKNNLTVTKAIFESRFRELIKATKIINVYKNKSNRLAEYKRI